MPYLSASEVVFHEEALYRVYVPLDVAKQRQLLLRIRAGMVIRMWFDHSFSLRWWLQLGFDFDWAAIRQRFDCTALRTFDDLRYDCRLSYAWLLQHCGINKSALTSASGLRFCDLNDVG